MQLDTDGLHVVNGAPVVSEDLPGAKLGCGRVQRRQEPFNRYHATQRRATAGRRNRWSVRGSPPGAVPGKCKHELEAR